MRTTLDIDDDILQAVKELARAEGKTAGKVLSELARRALTQQTPASGFSEEAAPMGYVKKDGFYQLPNRAGVVVTKEMVDRLIEEADDEEARRKGGY
jgi:hypothetical protein